MSEQAPEQRPGGKPSGSAAARGLKRKIGPLPMWAWGGLAIGGALAYYFAKGPGKTKKQTPTATPTAQATGPGAGLYPGYSSMPTATTTPTGTATSTATSSVTQTVTQNNQGGDEGSSDQDKRKHTGGWKGQHSNGQGSHHGKPGKPQPKPTFVKPGSHGQPPIAY